MNRCGCRALRACRARRRRSAGTFPPPEPASVLRTARIARGGGRSDPRQLCVSWLPPSRALSAPAPSRESSSHRKLEQGAMRSPAAGDGRKLVLGEGVCHVAVVGVVEHVLCCLLIPRHLLGQHHCRLRAACASCPSFVNRCETSRIRNALRCTRTLLALSYLP